MTLVQKALMREHGTLRKEKHRKGREEAAGPPGTGQRSCRDGRQVLPREGPTQDAPPTASR